MEFNQLLEEHFHNKRPKMLKMLGHKTEYAEDVVQEAYARALRYKDSFDASRDFTMWIGKIIHSCLMDHLRDENGYYVPDEEEGEEASIDCPSFPAHVMREIYELINTKSVIQMDVLNLYFRFEYSAKDISKITEYSYAQSHKIISRFREELKQLYK